MDLEGELPGLCEQYGSRSGSHDTRYRCDHVGVRRVKQHGAGRGLWGSLIKFMKEAFLPQGYPDTVSSDYLSYQLWDTLQAFCSSITGMLATLAILKGVGVGDESATPLAAALTWMFKDGAGMVSRILFAWVQGVDLDCNAKRWRLVADVLNDVGKCLELLAPLFPQLFLTLVCAASVSMAIVGSAGIATRAALVQHQARRDNMADVAAKDNSQETVVNLAGLLVNIWLTPLVAGNPVLVWGLFVVFTGLHLLANHRAVSVVCMETLNKNRLHIVMEDYLSSGRVPSPASVNAREPILTLSTRLLSYTLGAYVSSVVHSSAEYRMAVERFRSGHKYIVRFQRSRKNVLVALHRDSSAADQLRAAISVELLDYICQGSSSPVLSAYTDALERLKAAGDDGASLAGYVDGDVCPSLLPSLLPALTQAGWLTSHHLLAAAEWRYSWEL